MLTILRKNNLARNLTVNEKFQVLAGLLADYIGKMKNAPPLLRGLPAMISTLQTLLVMVPANELNRIISKANLVLECMSCDYDTKDEFSDHVKSLL